MRIVLDTNVFVGALLSPVGDNRAVVRACLKGAATPLFGAALMHEYEDLMGRADLMSKSPLNARERDTLLNAVLSVSEWVKIYYLWRPNLPDEADNHLVELALAGAADAIVTHNTKDLTRGQLSFPHLRILKPQSFLEAISWQP